MGKTIEITNSTYSLLVEKQKELMKKHGVCIHLKYMASFVIDDGIDKIEELLLTKEN